MLWRRTVPGDILEFVTTAGLLCLTGDQGTRGLHAATGRTAWAWNGAAKGDPLLAGDRGMLVTLDGWDVAALSASTGVVLWTFGLTLFSQMLTASPYCDAPTARPDWGAAMEPDVPGWRAHH